MSGASVTGGAAAGGVDVLGIVAMLLLLAGALLSLSAAVGLLRFPDVLSRLHPATKPQVLGVLLVLVAVGLRVGLGSPDLGMLVLAGLAQLLTIPVAAHMVGRAVHRTGRLPRSGLAIDELTAEESGRSVSGSSASGSSAPGRSASGRAEPGRSESSVVHE